MTATTITQRSARDLLSPKGFEAVVHTVQDNNEDMELSLAELIVEEALKFVDACALNPNVRLVPSRVVDEGWHALVLHTRMYRRLCYTLGHVVDHYPERPDPSRHDPEASDRTQAAIVRAGYAVERTLWLGPTDGGVEVSANCQHGPENPDSNCGSDQCSNTGPN